MKNTIRDILLLSVGFAGGAFFMHVFMKEAHEKLYQKEAQDLREHWEKREAQMDEEIEKKSKQKGIELAMNAYRMESDPEDIRKPEDAIEIIEPDEFGSEDDYETSFLTYYSDGKLAFDGEDEPVDDEDIPKIVGEEALKHFGEFEPNAIHVRNHNYHKDYEIMQVRQSFSDLHPEPYEEEK